MPVSPCGGRLVVLPQCLLNQLHFDQFVCFFLSHSPPRVTLSGTTDLSTVSPYLSSPLFWNSSYRTSNVNTAYRCVYAHMSPPHPPDWAERCCTFLLIHQWHRRHVLPAASDLIHPTLQVLASVIFSTSLRSLTSFCSKCNLAVSWQVPSVSLLFLEWGRDSVSPRRSRKIASFTPGQSQLVIFLSDISSLALTDALIKTAAQTLIPPVQGLHSRDIYFSGELDLQPHVSDGNSPWECRLVTVSIMTSRFLALLMHL